MLTCPKCGRKIVDEEAVYCPYCSRPLKTEVTKRTDFPTAGGVLLIIATTICVIAGIMALAVFLVTYQYTYYNGLAGYYSYMPRYVDLFAGFFGILALIYGLAAGILSLKRKKFLHCLIGGLLTVGEGFLIVIAFAQQWPSSWIIGMVFGAPMIILSVAGLLFVSIAKEEFRQ